MISTPREQIYMGVDYGDRRVGLALSDPSGLIARAYKTLVVSSQQEAAKKLLNECQLVEVQGIIVGYPVALDGGNRGERCRKVDEFIAELEKIAVMPIFREDERDSSAEAAQFIANQGHSKKQLPPGRLDMVSAAVILQRWLDEKKGKPAD